MTQSGGKYIAEGKVNTLTIDPEKIHGTLTEKSGRVNLGLEGVLVVGAMSGYATAVLEDGGMSAQRASDL